MINLIEFYKDNIKENDYYYKYYNDLVTIPHKSFQELSEVFDVPADALNKEDNEYFEIYDIDEAIEKFKYLCQPDTNITSSKNNRLFYYVCFYLTKNGYKIKEFPRILSRPPDDPYEFTYKEIRRKLVSMDKQLPNGSVPYAARRTLIEKLTFEKTSTIEVQEDIDKLFKKISTRNASFESMTTDEKIKEIANLIEYMLFDKTSKQYIQLNYTSVTFNYIDDNIIKNFRKQIQCFRHAKKSAIKERECFSNEQKEFMIDYGITIINVIYKLTKNRGD